MNWTAPTGNPTGASHGASTGTPSVTVAAPRRRGFTLIELLVVMGILLILAVVTTVAFGRVGQDVKLSSAINTVTTALGEARAIALRTNNLVLVTFRVGKVSDDPAKGQVTEIIIAEWTGITQPANDNTEIQLSGAPPRSRDLFRPVPGVPPRSLPWGIKVAAPRMDFSTTPPTDNVWITQPQIKTGEIDRAFAVLFGPDGSILTRNPRGPMTGQSLVYVDYNNNGTQDVSASGNNPNVEYWQYDEVADESNLYLTPFMAIFDDLDCRDRYNTSNWATNESERRTALTEYITQYADRINFNRHSGVVMR